MSLSRWLTRGQSAHSRPTVAGWGDRGEFIPQCPANGDAARVAAGVLVICVALVLIDANLTGVQKQDDKMVYLVARRGLNDPFFARSAVLMLPSGDLPLVVGLIVNRPTIIPLRRVFAQNPALKGKSETAYFGGPVDVHDSSVLFRTAQPPKGAIRLVADVYLSFDARLIDTLLANPQGTQDVRVFLGRSQWAPEQLQNEIQQGAWYSVEAESKLIFSADPQEVWHTLLNRSQPPNVVDYRLPALTAPPRPEALLIEPMRWQSLLGATEQAGTT